MRSDLASEASATVDNEVRDAAGGPPTPSGAARSMLGERGTRAEAKPRILHVSGGRVYGGIESYLAALASMERQAADVGYSFALAFPGRLADSMRAAGADLHVFGDDSLRASRPQGVLRARRELARVVRACGATVALVHAPWSYALFGGVLRRALPTVVMAHGTVRQRAWPDVWVRVRPPRGVIANSAWTEGEVRRAWPGVATRVVHPAVPAPLGAGASRESVRTALGVGPDDVVVVMASRLDPDKGHDVLLAALAALRTRGPWKAWIVGGPQASGEQETMDALGATIARAGLADRVRLLGQRDDVHDLLAAADIYCQPNRTPEAFGIVIVEAMYNGLPVVTSRLGGPMEIVTPESGVLVSTGDVAAFVAALGTLVDDGELRQQLSSGARRRAAEIGNPAARARALDDAVLALAGVPC